MNDVHPIFKPLLDAIAPSSATQSPIRFTIDPTVDTGTALLHGKPHSECEGFRYINLRAGEHGTISGYVKRELFTQLMRQLVSIEYDTPNWCEKCHLDGHGYCRCEIACNE